MSNVQSQFDNIINTLKAKTGNLTPVFTKILLTIQKAVEDNFTAHGRYNGDSDIGIFSGGDIQWEPLAQSTKKAYEKKGWVLEPTLYRSQSSGLRNTLFFQGAGNNTIVVGANSPYARIHQLGGGGGLNHAANIPARPFLTLTPEDVQDIVDTIGKYIVE